MSENNSMNAAGFDGAVEAERSVKTADSIMESSYQPPSPANLVAIPQRNEDAVTGKPITKDNIIPVKNIQTVAQGVAAGLNTLAYFNDVSGSGATGMSRYNPMNIEIEKVIEKFKAGDIDFYSLIGRFQVGLSTAALVETVWDSVALVAQQNREFINGMLGFELVGRDGGMSDLMANIKTAGLKLYEEHRNAVIIGGSIVLLGLGFLILKRTNLLDQAIVKLREMGFIGARLESEEDLEARGDLLKNAGPSGNA